MGCGISSSVKVAPDILPKPPSQEANTSSSPSPSTHSLPEAIWSAQSCNKDSHTTDKPLENERVEYQLAEVAPHKHSSQVCDISVTQNESCNDIEHTDPHVEHVTVLKYLLEAEQTDQVDSYKELSTNSAHGHCLTDEETICVHEHTPTDSVCANTEAPCSQSQALQPFQFVLRQSVGYSLSASPRIQLLQFKLGFINTITADQG